MLDTSVAVSRVLETARRDAGIRFTTDLSCYPREFPDKPSRIFQTVFYKRPRVFHGQVCAVSDNLGRNGSKEEN